MDIERVIKKYTGQSVTWQALAAAGRSGDPIARGLAVALERAASAVASAEVELSTVAGWISGHLTTVRANLDAAPGQRTRSINPLGELQANGPRLDALIGVRHERITHLRILATLWQEVATRGADPAPPDLPAALTALGFTGITAAHPSTLAAYGHRRGDRHVDVSVQPFGEPGVEVNAGRDGEVMWTATFGPHTPVAVVVGALRAALAQPAPDHRPRT